LGALVSGYRGVFYSIGMLTLITGGIKSGKSRFALLQARKEHEDKGFFIATAQPLDREMKQRIDIHRKDRGDDWITIEEPLDIETVFKDIPANSVVILDCLTLWVSNILHSSSVNDADRIVEKAVKFISRVRKGGYRCYIITNEVGSGIISVSSLAREYCDILGAVNAKFAAAADRVYLMVAGIGMKIKDGDS